MFVTERGVVGAVDRRSGRIQVLRLEETVTNSFAVDETGGIYLVSTDALYRLDLNRTGAPRVTWREKYANTGEPKPGQVSPGSGTTPTLMNDDWVAITDNADPMQIVVYRRGRHVQGRPGGVQRAGLQQGRQRHRQLADRSRPRARGDQQLRLCRAGADDRRHHHRPGHRAGRRGPRRQGLPRRVAQPHRAFTLGGGRSCRSPTDWSTPSPANASCWSTRGTSPRSTSAPAGSCSSSAMAPASATTSTTHRSASAPTVRRTSAS